MVVLDTHILFWWANQTPERLTRAQIHAIELADTLAISAMICWEMAWLVKHGRIVLHLPISTWLDEIGKAGIEVVPVSKSISLRAVELPEHHKDPADRIIIATTLELNAQIVSADERFPEYRELTGRLIR